MFFLSLFFSLASICDAGQQKQYFQQEVNYRISVSLDDNRHILNGSEIIEYINNSPDNLDALYFHLWPNAYSSNNTDLARQLFRLGGKNKLFNDESSRGFMDSLDFNVQGSKLNWEYLPEQPDICRIFLPEVLAPGDTIIISTPFRVKMPEGNISRMGYNDEAYQVSQWYPKPAVYDKEGWHPMPYLDQGEYFSEFGTFNVEITLPVDYVVASSGNLLTESEKKWLTTIASEWPQPDRFDTTGKEKTLHFEGIDIHDFAWVASKRFKVVTGKINLPASGREVTTMAVFTGRQAWLWEEAISYINRSILHFSDWIGDYSYDSFTAVQCGLAAGSGMEYPGLAIIGYAQDGYSLDEVISHEICHNWFYSAIGSDERRYPFMDEGITTSYEERYMALYYPDKKLWELYFRNKRTAKLMKIDELPAESISEIQWLISARNNMEQPLDLPAEEYTDRNYGDLIYYKTAQGFRYLRSYLGDSLFDSIMHEYYYLWRTRHPSPNDIREVFERRTGRDLSWFFEDFISTTGMYDYSVRKLGNNRLSVKNNGELISPVHVSGFRGDSLIFTSWHDGFAGKKWINLPDSNVTSIRLNSDHIIPEIFHLNNNIRSTGLFRRSDPLRPQLLVSIEDPERRTFMMIPLLNWNRSDGFMAGVAVSNGTLIPKPVEYRAMPFFSFRDPGIKGKARIALNLIPFGSIVRKLTLSIDAARFGSTEFQNYNLLKPGLEVHFRNNRFISSTEHSAFLRYIHSSEFPEVFLDVKAGMERYWQAGYSYIRTSLVNPFMFTAMIESGNSYTKTSAEFNYKVSYNGINQGLEFRLFTGTMLKSALSDESPYLFAPSGRGGSELYLFQGDFPDRFATFSSSFWSRQMSVTEGAIVSPVNLTSGYSRSLLSASVSSSLPGFFGRLPLKPFANAVYDTKTAYYEAGIKAGIWGFFEIHVPLLVSDNIKVIRDSIKNRIRFSLNLESIYRLRL